jgi:hypothetical protein
MEVWWGPGGSQKLRERVSDLQVLLKPTITYGKGRTLVGDPHPIIDEWGEGRGPGEGGS